MALNPLPLPIETPLVDRPNERGDQLINFLWLQAFTTRDQQLADASKSVVKISRTAQAASLGATAISVGTSAGDFRINLYARVTQAATTSSSLQPTFRWTEGGVAQSRTYTAATGNTTTTLIQDVFVITIDALSAVTYETSYASVGATPMQYSLLIIAEQLT